MDGDGVMAGVAGSSGLGFEETSRGPRDRRKVVVRTWERLYGRGIARGEVSLARRLLD
jgi:hypothetical protein